MAGLFGHVHGATRRTLAAAGYRETAAPGQTCCGALHAHAGLLAAARHRARRNVAAFEGAAPERIVANSAGCGAALREYPRWLADDPEWARRAEAIAERTRDVSELVVGVGGRLRGRVAYDAPCHLSHGQGVRDEPRALLAAIEGLEVGVHRSSERCCGGAGVYNLLRPKLSRRVLDGKLEELRTGGFDWVATGNPGCIMQIGAGLLEAGVTARAVHPVELLDAAHDGSDRRSQRRSRAAEPSARGTVSEVEIPPVNP